MPARVFPSPERRYVLLQLSDGTFLTHDPTSARARLDVAPHCGDDACWLLQPAEGARNSRLVHHSGSVELFGAVVGSSTGDDEDPLSDPVWELLIPSELELPESWAKSATGAMRMNVVVVEGPGSLPSEYLSTLATDGFVVCPNLLGDRLLGRLRHDIRQMRASPELQDQGVPAGAPGDSQVNQGRAAVRETAGRVDLINCINESANFVRMATHPVMQHMLTSYLGTTAVRLAHAPAVGITKPLGLAVGPDGALVEEQKDGGGWHVDYPLHDMGSPFPPEVVLGAQCNVCIDDFSVSNSTNFIIGSHQTRRPPPAEFNARGNEHFPPYAPQVVDQIECPGGSLIMYNANTWHRSGLNISADRERAACLHAFTPEWVLPKHDQMSSFNNFVESGSFDRLNEREQADVRQLWIGKLTEQRHSLGMTAIEQHQHQQGEAAAVARL